MPVWATKETCDKVLPGLAKQEIIVPAWNDVIHLTRPPSYTDAELKLINEIAARKNVVGWSEGRIAEYLGISSQEVRDSLRKYAELQEYQQKRIQTALDLQKSPSPDLARNLGTIMTAIDDVQDFTTTVGVLSRVLGRVFKPAELLAIGAFTVGEFLNRLSMMNKLTGSEKAVICSLVKSLKNSSQHTTIKSDVDKRMKRLFPSKGEMLEIAQTTDSLFGVGISLGPLVGLLEDAVFGVLKGVPVRFKDWKVSDREREVMRKITTDSGWFELMLAENMDKGLRWAESAANTIISGESLGWNDFATGLVTSIYTGVGARCTKVKEAAIDIWEAVSGKGATPKKKTLESTKEILRGVGVDPYRLDEWPVPGLGSVATIQEIMDAYSEQANKVLKYWRVKTQGTDEGLFLDACVKEIGLHASAMFCAEDGKITESLNPFALIFIHALEVGLNPPASASAESFLEWIQYISNEMLYLDLSAPPQKLLERAYQKYF